MEKPAANSSTMNNDPGRNSRHYCEKTKGSSSASGKDSNLLKDLSRIGLKTIDKREVGGALWIIGDKSIEATVRRIERQYKVRFNYCENGSRSSGGKPSWWTKHGSVDRQREDSRKQSGMKRGSLSPAPHGDTILHGDPSSFPKLILERPISSSLTLTPKIHNVLQEDLGCKTVEDLFSASIDEFVKTRGITNGAVQRIRDDFESYLEQADKEIGAADDDTLIDQARGDNLSDWHKTGRIVRYFDVEARIIVILRSLNCITIGDLFKTRKKDYLSVPGATEAHIKAIEAAYEKFIALHSAQSTNADLAPTLPADELIGAHPTNSKQFATIINPLEIAFLSDAHKEMPIHEFLELTPGVLKSLSTINCNTVNDLGTTPADSFVALRGVSTGTLGTVRREFRRRLSQPEGSRSSKKLASSKKAGQFPNTPTKINRHGPIVDHDEIALLPTERKTTPIRAFLDLTPGVLKALSSIDCVKVEDLGTTAIKDFIAIKGMTLGTVGKIRKEFSIRNRLCASAKSEPSLTTSFFLEDKLASLPEGVHLRAWKRDLSIEDTLKLPPATVKALKAIGCSTLNDLLETDCFLLIEEKGMGPKSIQRIHEQFNAFVREESGSRFSGVEPPSAELAETVGSRYAVCRPVPKSIELTNYIKAFGLPNEWGAEATLADWLELPFDEANHPDLSSPELCQLEDERQRIDLLFHEPLGFITTSAFRRAYKLSLEEALQFAIRVAGPSFDLAMLKNKISLCCPTMLKGIPLLWLIDYDEERYAGKTVGDFLMSSTITAEQLLLSTIAAHRYETLASITDQADSCAQLLAQCVTDSNPKINCRALDIIVERNCGLQKKTLQSLADKHEITRSRIQQIEQKASKDLNIRASLRFYLARIAAVKAALDLGGIGSVEKLTESISASGFSLASTVSDIVRLVPEIILDKEGDLFTLKSHPCSMCQKLTRSVEELLNEGSSMPFASLQSKLGCKKCHYPPSAKWIASQYQGLSTDETRIGSSKCLDIKTKPEPKSVRGRVLNLLEESGRALTYEDLASLYKEKYGEDVEKARIMSHVGSSDDSLLWGRGTYIHKRYASYPKSLIGELCDYCVELFAINRTAILGVGGIYDSFKNRLQIEEVPNEQALYSMIRMNEDSRLKLREYPWICDAATIGNRTSFAKYFYSILAANNGFITDSHAESVASRCLAQRFALGGLAEYSNYVIRANGGWYDVAAADFDMAGIAALAREISEEMAENDIISTVAVFENNKERCLKYGVKSHDILYYLIDMLEDDLPIEATRKPHLTKSKHKGLSVLAAIRLYINNSDNPVSSEELHEEFITKRKLKLRGICGSLIVDGETILVGSNLFWSREKLRLNTNYIEQFDRAIAEKMKCTHKVADLFYPVSSVLPTLRDLPSPAGLTWNPTLLSTVFGRSKHFRLFGENGTCIVSVAENPNVTNVETFYHELLSKEFYGWSTFDSFSEYCEAYSIRANLEPEFFDAFSSIEADEMSIEAL